MTAPIKRFARRTDTTPAEIDPPQLRSLRAAVSAFRGPGAEAVKVPQNPALGPGFDPAVAGHCSALLTWLNAWGCRIQYPREGEADLFGAGMRAWWTAHGPALPGPDVTLAELCDEDIERARDGFSALLSTVVGHPQRPRVLGPTAASKVLHALRPTAFLPWDDAIARHLHGGRDATAYAAHLRLGRLWARDLLARTGIDEQALSTSLGAPGRPLSKILDDYCYLRFTRSQVL